MEPGLLEKSEDFGRLLITKTRVIIEFKNFHQSQATMKILLLASCVAAVVAVVAVPPINN